MSTAPQWEALREALGDIQGPLGPRSANLREALSPCLGPRPELATLPPPEAASPFVSLRVTHKHRAALCDAAMEVFDGVLAAEFDRVAPHLGEVVTVLWPDGTLARHPAPALVEHLLAEDRPAAPVVVRDLRTYLPGELRSVLPQGLAEQLAAVSPASGAVAVTAQLDSRRGARGRALLYALPEDQGWRVLSLLLPSPDDVVVAGKKPSAAEHEAVRVADRVVRHWLLGHASQLDALRNHLMDQIWLGSAPCEAERLRAELPAEPPLASWLVFLGTQLLGEKGADRVLGPAEGRRIEQEAKALWRRPWSRLRPAWTATKVGVWDPNTRSVQQPFEVRCLLMQVDDVDARDEVTARWRLAGLFDPQPPSLSPKS